MYFFSLDQIFQLLESYRYFLLFPIAVIEGPIITVIAGYLSYLGFFDFGLAYLLMVLGDLGGDIIYYAIGRWGRLKIVEKYGHYLGISTKKIIEMEKLFKSHDAKALIGGKFIFGIGGIIIIAAGAVKVNFGKFISYCTLGTLPKSFLLMVLGYYFGHAYAKIGKIFDYTALVSIAIVIIILAVYYLIQRYVKQSIAKK